jgi:hypothetical protein
MRHKSELYKKEQDEIVAKLLSILDLENNNPIILYNLDNNIELQQKIIGLIPEIRTFFTFYEMPAVCEPHKFKRPYFLIIKYLLKSTYTISKKEFHFTENGKYIRTVKYFFMHQPDSSSLSK